MTMDMQNTLSEKKRDGCQEHAKSALKTLPNCLLTNYIFVYKLCLNKKYKICNKNGCKCLLRKQLSARRLLSNEPKEKK